MQKFSTGFFSVLDPTVKFINFMTEKYFSKKEAEVINMTSNSKNKNFNGKYRNMKIINIDCEEIGQSSP